MPPLPLDALLGSSSVNCTPETHSPHAVAYEAYAHSPLYSQEGVQTIFPSPYKIGEGVV
jgi:hypothetical protein